MIGGAAEEEEADPEGIEIVVDHLEDGKKEEEGGICRPEIQPRQEVYPSKAGISRRVCGICDHPCSRVSERWKPR